MPEKCFVKSKSKMEKVREIYWRRKENSNDWLWFIINVKRQCLSAFNWIYHTKRPKIIDCP